MHRIIGSATHACDSSSVVYFELGGHVKLFSSTGSRTRVDCLEGNHASRYTTDAGNIKTVQ